MINPNNLLTIQNLTVSYTLKKKLFSRQPAPVLQALRGVSFSLNKSETLGVVGESGCGKSTLARSILGLTTETNGDINYKNVSLTALTPNQRRKACLDMQLIFQDPLDALNSRRTVGQIIREPLEILCPSLSRQAQINKVYEMIQAVGLKSEHYHRYPHTFSGGQCQRISIARSMIAGPGLVICDEPVSALDVSIQAQIIQLLKDLQAKTHVTYLFISHDLSVIHHMCDRIMVLYLGKVVEIGTTKDIYRNPKHPYTQALLRAIPTIDNQEEKAPLDGECPSPLNPPRGCAFHTRCPHATELCHQSEPLLKNGVACHHWDKLLGFSHNTRHLF
jgi:oligopeptide transport system ATP-binding protein